jgi:hypothetical protein
MRRHALPPPLSTHFPRTRLNLINHSIETIITRSAILRTMRVLASLISTYLISALVLPLSPSLHPPLSEKYTGKETRMYLLPNPTPTPIHSNPADFTRVCHDCASAIFQMNILGYSAVGEEELCAEGIRRGAAGGGCG